MSGLVVRDVLEMGEGRLSNTQAQVRFRADGDPVSGEEVANGVSNDVWPVLGPTPPLTPFIRGSVIGRKAENRKAPSTQDDRAEEEVAEFYG